VRRLPAIALDLEPYLARIGYSDELTPTVRTLRELHLAHATHVPFENVDVLLRRPILLDLDSITAKLVRGGRGGYCFEHNSLFAAVLEQIGFRVKRLAGRVQMGAPTTRPRTHMALAVSAEGEDWLADVGFGLEGLLYPVPLKLNQPVHHFGWKYRITGDGCSYILQSFHRPDDGPACILQSAHPDGWLPLYSFTLDEEHPGDHEMANYFISTHPRSPMVRTLLVQRPGVELRLMLRNRLLIERTPASGSVTELRDDAAILAILAERFGLHFPPGTRFPFDPSM
jgi:N-hydroxyarylamine O-acetyltransferase